MLIACDNCKADFDRPIYVIKRNERENHKNFCSAVCRNIYAQTKRAEQAKGQVYTKREKATRLCKVCSNPLKSKGTTFCSQKCQHEQSYRDYIERWLVGDEKGDVANGIKVAAAVKRYIWERAENKCEQCGWCKVNPFTETIPLEIHHINNVHDDTRPENLMLLCPNCHSLTAGHSSSNPNGRSRKKKVMYGGGSLNG